MVILNIFIIEFISNDPTQNDWEGFKNVLQKIYSSEIIFGLIMDFTTLRNSGMLSFNKALDILLFFKKTLSLEIQYQAPDPDSVMLANAKLAKKNVALKPQNFT